MEEVGRNKNEFNEFPHKYEIDVENCNIAEICRICLSGENGLLHPLMSFDGETNLSDIFTCLTTIEVTSDDGLPQHICDLCKTNVIKFYEFRKHCIKSDSMLKTILKEHCELKSTQSVKVDMHRDLELDATVIDDWNLEGELDVKDEDLMEDTQYLEEFDDIENEAKCITQNDLDDVKIDTELQLTVADKSPKFLRKSKGKSEKKSKQKNGKKSNTLNCSFCKKRFNNLKALGLHSKRCHITKECPPCPHCGEAFHSEHDLDIHLPLHMPGPKWKCVQCDKEFKGRTMFRRHIRRHMYTKRYACETCGKTFTELYALKRHARVHTGETLEKKFACLLCEKRFTENKQLRMHMSRHNGSRPCICDVCGKAFPSTRLLTSHHLVHSDDKPYQCKYCDKRFRHDSTRNTHHRTHTGEKPYVCSTCGKRFIQNSNLTLHMRTHTGEKPYKCDTCERSFSSGSTLKAHVRTHTGEKPFGCNICGKKFSRSVVRAHLRSHSGERPYACTVCARRFVTQARLREHCRVHTGERAYECATCSRKFSSKTHIIQHIKAHESNKIMRSPINQDTKKGKHPQQLNEQGIGEAASICVANEVGAELNYVPDVNLVTVDDSGVRISASSLDGTTVKLYQLDQSLLQIHSAGGQVTISKITSKMTANF